MGSKSAVPSASARSHGLLERSKVFLLVLLTLAMVVCAGLGAESALADGPGTLVDAGFENGVDGAALARAVDRCWAPRSAPSTTTPAPRTATLSGWIQGPAPPAVPVRSRPPLAT